MNKVLKPFSVSGRIIGIDQPTFMIAELSANHAGNLNKAIELIEAAKEAGADAVKLQTYTPDTMTIPSRNEEFMIRGGLWDGYNLYDLYKEAHTPWEWHPRLFKRAAELDIICFSTPFDSTAVDYLENIGCPIYKIASFELTDLELIRKVASCGKPMIMSTGLANKSEIQSAVNVARDYGCDQLALLHCVSAYPAPTDEANIRTIADMKEQFGVNAVGLSDHTLSPAVAVAAVVCGASIVEKHFTLRRSDGGADSAFSMEPKEFSDLVIACKDAVNSLGHVHYGYTASEKNNLKFRRSIFAISDILKGDEFSYSNIRVIRPGYGLDPSHYMEIIGRRAERFISRGSPIDWSMVK